MTDPLDNGYSDEYRRRWERTGIDPLGIYRPQSCWKAGHVPGCPGLAGGDHELLPGWISIGDPDEGYAIEMEVSDAGV